MNLLRSTCWLRVLFQEIHLSLNPRGQKSAFCCNQNLNILQCRNSTKIAWAIYARDGIRWQRWDQQASSLSVGHQFQSVLGLYSGLGNMLTKHLAMFARDRARARQSKAQTQAEQATCTCLSKRITKLMNVLHDLFQGGLNRKSNELKLATQVNTGRQAGQGSRGRGGDRTDSRVQKV